MSLYTSQTNFLFITYNSEAAFNDIEKKKNENIKYKMQKK